MNNTQNDNCKIKKVFVDSLPRWDKNGKYINCINWKQCIGKEVKFIYNSIKGSVKILEYNYPNLIVLYNNKKHKIATSSFLQCRLGNIVGVIKKEYHYNVGDVIDTKSGRIEIKKQIRYYGKRAYCYKCLIDGYEGVTNEYNLKRGSGCLACTQKIVRVGIDDVASTHSELVKYFINLEDAYKYSKSSEVFLNFMCPDCGFVKNIQIKTLTRNNGFICAKCGDGISYPEKFLFNFLEQLNIEFITQLNKKTLQWCGSYKYDFYIPNINCIVEVNGSQHYTRGMKHLGGRSLEEEQKNDSLKQNLAKKNGVIEFIVINCEKSNLEHISNNISESRLSKLFDLSTINWEQCHEFACCSRVKEVSDLWSGGMRNVVDIAKKVNLHKSTVRRYLKQGERIGWNDYDANIAKRSNGIKNKIKVICLNTLEVFNSSKEVELKYNIHSSNISRICNNTKGNANFVTINDAPFVFMHYDKYLNESVENINAKIRKAKKMYLKSSKPKNIICLNTCDTYTSIQEAEDKTGVCRTGISRCCSGKQEFAGKSAEGEKLVWMFYEEYIKKSIKEINKIILDAQDRKIICITTNKIFNSIKLAGEYYNIKNFNSNVHNNLNNKTRYCGTLDDGTKLSWMFYDDYLKKGKRKYINKHSKRVRCMSTGAIFDSVVKLSRVSLEIYGVFLNQAGIARVCRGERVHYKGYRFEYIKEGFYEK